MTFSSAAGGRVEGSEQAPRGSDVVRGRDSPDLQRIQTNQSKNPVSEDRRELVFTKNCSKIWRTRHLVLPREE